MKRYINGYHSHRIKTTDPAAFKLKCEKARKEGYELHKVKVKRDWPRFWRWKYKAEYRKYYIIDTEKIAFFSKKDIDYIVTGK